MGANYTSQSQSEFDWYYPHLYTYLPATLSIFKKMFSSIMTFRDAIMLLFIAKNLNQIGNFWNENLKKRPSDSKLKKDVFYGYGYTRIYDDLKKNESFGEDKGLGKNPVSKQNFRFIHKR